MTQPLKVTIIGAASPQWGAILARDIIVTLAKDEITSQYTPHLVLEDIDPVQLTNQEQLAQKITLETGNKVVITSTTNQQEALDGASFVVVSFAVGSYEAMLYDIEIPQDYGIYQPVGDTFSIGGAIRAARNIPALLSIAEDMKKYSAKNAWLINLSNPMSTLCRAVTKVTDITTIGLCHELYGGLHTLSKFLGFDYNSWRENLEFDVLGINHCGWLQYLSMGDIDLFDQFTAFLHNKGITQEVMKLYDSKTPELTRENVKINLFLRYGIFPYSGDRHTAEFFSEFINKDTNKGADYGVLLTSIQERLVHWRGEARNRVNQLLRGEEKIDLTVSQEATSKIIRCMLLDEEFYDVGNIPYHGTDLPGIPDGVVLERMVTYRKNSVIPNKVAPLPSEVQKHLILTTKIIEEIVNSCIKGDRKLLIQALKNDPLLQNMSSRKIPEMVNKLLEINKQWLNPAFY